MMSEEPGRGVDPYRPQLSRMYARYLGGKDHFTADEKAAEEVIEVSGGEAPKVAREIRQFVYRAVSFCVNTGVRQVLDVGPGLPVDGVAMPPNVFEVVLARPGGRYVGIDNDPVVISHGRALAAAGARFGFGDLAEPDRIVTSRVVGEVIDWDRPVLIVCSAVLHFADDHTVAAALEAFRQVAVQGSYLVVSHVTCDGSDPEVTAKITDIYRRTRTGVFYRTTEQIRAMFAGFELVDPGLVAVQDWRPNALVREALTGAVRVLGAVGRRP